MYAINEDLEYRDESINVLEKYLLSYNIVMEPLTPRTELDQSQTSVRSGNECKKDERVFRRNKLLWVIIQILMGFSMVRYCLLATAHTENVISRVLGDTFRNFGAIPRTVFYISVVGQGSFAVGYDLITRYFERHDLLDYLTDMKNLKGLSPENYRYGKMCEIQLLI